MRIIAGTAKGRRLAAPRSRRPKGHRPKGRESEGPRSGEGDIRPTADRVREAVFDILGEAIQGARFLDVFSGTGAVAAEALSRGASSTVLLERDRQALRIIQRNLEGPGFEPDRWEVLPGDALTSLARLRREERTFDIIYVDPPYASTLGAEALEEAARLLDPDGVAVLEHDARSAPPESALGNLTETRRFGDTAITLYGPGGPRRP